MKQRKTTPEARSPKIMKRSTASVILSVVSAFFIALTALGLWLFRDYIADPALLRDRIGEHYFIGAVFMVLISAVQVIVALLPGEFVEIAAGYVFGSWMGSLLCLAGIVLGSCTTILLVRRFGRKFVYAFYPKEKIENLPILREPAKRNLLTFLLFAIPGTPKDLFTYAIGLTDMSIPLYIALTTVARFPSVILSTLSGNAAGTRDWSGSIIFIVISVAVSGIGLLIYNRFSKKHRETTPHLDGSASDKD